MAKLIYTTERTAHSIGYIGGSAEDMPIDLWPKIPNTDTYQTHLVTLYPEFLPTDLFPSKKSQISIFISLAKHALGGVKESLSSRYTVHSNEEFVEFEPEYSRSILYQVGLQKQEQNLSPIEIGRKYFEVEHDVNSPEYQEYLEKERLCYEEMEMGSGISKTFDLPYFEQDHIEHPEYEFWLQLVEEDIDDGGLCIFHDGIGYFYYNKNVDEKLKSGSEAGIFFIQYT